MRKQLCLEYGFILLLMIAPVACSSTENASPDDSGRTIPSAIDSLAGCDLSKQQPEKHGLIEKNIYQEQGSEFRYVIFQDELTFYFFCLYSIENNNGLAVAEYSDSENGPVWREVVRDFEVVRINQDNISIRVKGFDKLWPRSPFKDLSIEIRCVESKSEAFVNGGRGYLFSFNLENVNKILNDNLGEESFAIGDLEGELKPRQVGSLYQVIESLGVSVEGDRLKQMSFPEWIVQELAVPD